MRELIPLRKLAKLAWARSPFLWAALLTAGGAQAQSDVDILVNHDSFYGGESATEGPAGGTFTYRPKVKVNGSETVENVSLKIQLPAGSQFVQASPSDTSVLCANLPDLGTVFGASDEDAITCTVTSLDGQFKWVDVDVILPEVGVAARWTALASARLPGGLADADNDVNNSNLERGFTTNEASDLAIAISAHDGADEIVNRDIGNGDPFSYHIAVTNAGPSEIPAAGNARVTFEVPAGASITGEPTGDGWNCTPSAALNTGIYTCDYKGPIAGKAIEGDAPYALPVLVFPAETTSSGPIGAAASVQGYLSDTTIHLDGQLGNNTANVLVTATGEDWLDLTLAKTADTGSAQSPLDAANLAGAPVVFTLTPRYAAGGLAPSAMVVTDALPEGLTFTSFDPSTAANGWTCEHNAATITCELATSALPVARAYGNLPAIIFTAQAVPQASGSIVNTARVAAAPTDAEPTTTNNTGTATIHFSNTAQLKLSKSGPTAPIQSGQPFQYSLTVTNQGPMPITAGQTITLTDTPASPLQLTSFDSSSATGWSCPDAIWGQKGGAVECLYTVPVGTSLAANESVTLVLNALVSTADVPENGYLRLNNAADIAAGTGPGSREWLAVNSSANVTVSAQFADLMVQKVITSPDAGQAATGDLVTYAITVTNLPEQGAQTAQGIQLTDILSDLVTKHDGGESSIYPEGGLVSYVPGDGNTCDASGNENSRSRTLTCAIGDLAPGESTTVTVTIRPRIATATPTATSPMQFRNTAKVESSYTADHDLRNNTSDADINLTALTEIGVVKQVSPANPAAGQPVTYSLAVQNHGPSSAQNVRLVDALPEGLVLMGDAAATGAQCFHSTNQDASSGTPLDGQEGGFLICTWAEPLNKPNDALGQFQVTYKARPKGTLAEHTVLENTVTVSTSTAERGTVPNTDSAEITLQPAQFDVQITMGHSEDGLAFGEETEYTIVVTNALASTSYATGVKMHNIFPTTLVDARTGKTLASTAVFSYQGGLTVTPLPGTKEGYPSGVDGTVGAGSVNASMCTTEPAVDTTSGPLECVFPLMAPGDRVQIKFKMRADSILDAAAKNGSILHAASVSAIETEAMPLYDASENNTTTDRTSTNRRPASERPPIDAALTKEGPGGFPKAGDTLTYVITVSNYGQNTIPAGGQMIDTLPDALRFVSVKRSSAEDSGCADADGVLTCTLPEMPRGASVEFVVETIVNDGFTGPYPITNSARVVVADDGDDTNNEDSTTTDQPNPPVAVPSLNTGAVLLLALFMLAMAWRARRRGQ